MIISQLLLVFFASVSAQELLINGDFSAGTSGWAIYDGGVRGDYGSDALKVWATGGQWDVGFALQEVPVTPGEMYTFSADVLHSNSEPLPGTGGTAFLKFEFLDGNRTIINGPYGTLLDSINGTAALNTWLPLSGSMTAPAGSSTVNAVLMVQDTGGGTSVAWFDNASLTGPDLDVVNNPDYDNSLRVDLADFVKLAGAWQQTSSTYNLSGSHLIDLDDLVLFANGWLDQITPYPGYELVWSDEFYGPNINTNNWNWEIGAGGWGNNEWQYYTNHSDNSYISNGDLVIVARKNHLNYDYTSARITTKNKQSFMYGRMEARIKLPVGGNGMWPAFWMLGEDISSVGWPECGEIDILEAVNDFTEVVGAVHYGSGNPYVHDYNSSGYNPGQHVSADYHIYAIEWEPTEIRWYFDDVNFRKTSNWWNSDPYPAPFNQPFFFILNIAVGGNWPGYPDTSTSFPQFMYIDYVRVYQKTSP